MEVNVEIADSFFVAMNVHLVHLIFIFYCKNFASFIAH